MMEEQMNNSEQQPMEAPQTEQPAPEASKMQEPMSEEDKKDIEENKLIAALSYLGILVLVPMLAKKESKFAQYHAKQGLMLIIIWILIAVIAWIPVLGWMLGPILWLVLMILDIIALIQALTGKYWEMPVIGKLAQKYLKNL